MTKQNQQTLAKKAKQNEFIEIFKNKVCNISEACKALKINRGTYYLWLNDKKFNQAIEEAKESLIDYAESVFYEKVFGKRNKETGEWITEPETTAQIFHLKCKGKSRGWVERQEITGAEGGPVKMVYKTSFLNGEELKPNHDFRVKFDEGINNNGNGQNSGT